MVESFERAKSTWHRWIDEHFDHAFQLSDADPLVDWFRTSKPQRLKRILVTPGDPTTEVLALCMMAKLGAFLTADGGRLQCVEIRIDETPTNTAIFKGDPLAALPPSIAPDRWWTRADMSINDLHSVKTQGAADMAVAAERSILLRKYFLHFRVKERRLVGPPYFVASPVASRQ